MASLYANSASEYHIGFGYGWGNGRFGGGMRRGFVIDGGQWRSGWSTLQEDDKSKFGLNPGAYSEFRGDFLIGTLLDEQIEVDGTETPEPWGKGRCYREEWFGGGYANVTREQRDRMTRGQFFKDAGVSVGGLGTLGKREHDDKFELVGEKRRQAETRATNYLGQGQLLCSSKDNREDGIGTLGDFRSCAGVLNMDLMFEGFKDEAIVLEKFGRCGGDLANDRAVLDWGGSKSLWEEALIACLEPAEEVVPNTGLDHTNPNHDSLIHSCREHSSPVCTPCSDLIVSQGAGRTVGSYMNAVLGGCNMRGVWSGDHFVQAGSSSKEDVLGEVSNRQLWEENAVQVNGLNVFTNQIEYLQGEGHFISGEAESGKHEGPPEGFVFALSHLDLQSLLRLERVSKSLRDAVKGDVLIWQHIHVEQPLSSRITDDILIHLAKRSEGRLKSLKLMECVKITAAGLEQVLLSNLEVEKLWIPRCSGVKAEAIVRIVESHALKSRAKGFPGIKQLRIKGVYNITRQQVEVLLGVLQHGRDLQDAHKPYRPHYYRNGNHGVTRDHASDDERPIDLEPCPKCGNARMVYDCTRERCQQEKAHPGLTCRGCTFCIARCEECGTCINDLSYEETFCLDLLCSACWYRLPKCSECNKPGCGRQAEDFVRSPDTTFTCEDCRAGAAGPEFHVPGEM